jgi:hypothetical protein
MDAKMTVPDGLRHFRINDLTAVLAVSSFNDISDNEDRDRNYSSYSF